jgi:hypothetical protein
MANDDPTYETFIKQARDYGHEAERYQISNPNEARELYEQGLEALSDAKEKKTLRPQDVRMQKMFKKQVEQLGEFEANDSQDYNSVPGQLELKVTPAGLKVTPLIIGALGAFSLVFLSNGITGNAIGSSGNAHSNMMMGGALLLVALAATFILFRKNHSSPHPEKTRLTKTKTRKSRKKK